MFPQCSGVPSGQRFTKVTTLGALHEACADMAVVIPVQHHRHTAFWCCCSHGEGCGVGGDGVVVGR